MHLSYSFNFYLFFVAGWMLGYTNSAIILISLAALLIRRRRRVLCAAIAVLSWIVVGSGTICAIAYVSEAAIALFSSNRFGRYTFLEARLGSYWWPYWMGILGSVVAPQMFWFRRCRTTAWISFAISLLILAPFAVEKTVRYFTEQSEFLPSSWTH